MEEERYAVMQERLAHGRTVAIAKAYIQHSRIYIVAPDQPQGLGRVRRGHDAGTRRTEGGMKIKGDQWLVFYNQHRRPDQRNAPDWRSFPEMIGWCDLELRHHDLGRCQWQRRR
jgi:hypothetical protein